MHVRLTLAAGALALAAGCAPRYMAIPTEGRPVPGYVIEPDPAIADRFGHTRQPLNDARDLHYVQSRGGSLAVGLLFGPLGVAANVSAVEKRTTEEAALLKDKLPLAPRAALQEVARKYPEIGRRGPAARAVRLTPEIVVVRSEDEHLLIGCLLLVDYRPAGVEWRTQYLYQTTARLPVFLVVNGMPADQLRELEEHVRQGFSSLVALYLDDLDGRLPPGREILFKSTFLTPGGPIPFDGRELPWSSSRAVIRGVHGMFSFPRGTVEIEDRPGASSS